ncbi:MAG TPA: hypothetical protein VLL04_02350, partial [Rhizomicrobium sp.]|nr:hypothetical protein [Rhizomicrobium sp.]
NAAMAIILALAATMPSGAAHAQTRDPSIMDPEWRLTGTVGVTDTNGAYGTPNDINVLLGLTTLSLSNDSFKFSASLPYMRISGRGLLVFDANGNPIVINRRANGPTDVRTGWGDLTLSASYTIPPSVLADFQVRITGITKLPTGPARRRLNTGEADFGMNVDVSRSFGDWTPFVTVGYLNRGQPAGFTFYDTSSVSVGASYVLRDNLVAVASYDYDSADAPQVTAGHEFMGSLSWIRDDKLTLTGYGTVGLSSGSPDFGIGFLVSYGLN